MKIGVVFLTALYTCGVLTSYYVTGESKTSDKDLYWKLSQIFKKNDTVLRKTYKKQAHIQKDGRTQVGASVVSARKENGIVYVQSESAYGVNNKDDAKEHAGLESNSHNNRKGYRVGSPSIDRNRNRNRYSYRRQWWDSYKGSPEVDHWREFEAADDYNIHKEIWDLESNRYDKQPEVYKKGSAAPELSKSSWSSKDSDKGGSVARWEFPDEADDGRGYEMDEGYYDYDDGPDPYWGELSPEYNDADEEEYEEEDEDNPDEEDEEKSDEEDEEKPDEEDAYDPGQAYDDGYSVSVSAQSAVGMKDKDKNGVVVKWTTNGKNKRGRKLINLNYNDGHVILKPDQGSDTEDRERYKENNAFLKRTSAHVRSNAKNKKSTKKDAGVESNSKKANQNSKSKSNQVGGNKQNTNKDNIIETLSRIMQNSPSTVDYANIVDDRIHFPVDLPYILPVDPNEGEPKEDSNIKKSDIMKKSQGKQSTGTQNDNELTIHHRYKELVPNSRQGYSNSRSIMRNENNNGMRMTPDIAFPVIENRFPQEVHDYKGGMPCMKHKPEYYDEFVGEGMDEDEDWEDEPVQNEEWERQDTYGSEEGDGYERSNGGFPTSSRNIFGANKDGTQIEVPTYSEKENGAPIDWDGQNSAEEDMFFPEDDEVWQSDHRRRGRKRADRWRRSRLSQVQQRGKEIQVLKDKNYEIDPPLYHAGYQTIARSEEDALRIKKMKAHKGTVAKNAEDRSIYRKPQDGGSLDVLSRIADQHTTRDTGAQNKQLVQGSSTPAKETHQNGEATHPTKWQTPIQNIKRQRDEEIQFLKSMKYEILPEVYKRRYTDIRKPPPVTKSPTNRSNTPKNSVKYQTTTTAPTTKKDKHNNTPDESINYPTTSSASTTENYKYVKTTDESVKYPTTSSAPTSENYKDDDTPDESMKYPTTTSAPTNGHYAQELGDWSNHHIPSIPSTQYQNQETHRLDSWIYNYLLSALKTIRRNEMLKKRIQGGSNNDQQQPSVTSERQSARISRKRVRGNSAKLQPTNSMPTRKALAIPTIGPTGAPAKNVRVLNRVRDEERPVDYGGKEEVQPLQADLNSQGIFARMAIESDETGHPTKVLPGEPTNMQPQRVHDNDPGMTGIMNRMSFGDESDEVPAVATTKQPWKIESIDVSNEKHGENDEANSTLQSIFRSEPMQTNITHVRDGGTKTDSSNLKPTKKQKQGHSIKYINKAKGNQMPNWVERNIDGHRRVHWGGNAVECQRHKNQGKTYTHAQSNSRIQFHRVNQANKLKNRRTYKGKRKNGGVRTYTYRRKGNYRQKSDRHQLHRQEFRKSYKNRHGAINKYRRKYNGRVRNVYTRKRNEHRRYGERHNIILNHERKYKKQKSRTHSNYKNSRQPYHANKLVMSEPVHNTRHSVAKNNCMKSSNINVDNESHRVVNVNYQKLHDTQSSAIHEIRPVESTEKTHQQTSNAAVPALTLPSDSRQGKDKEETSAKTKSKEKDGHETENKTEEKQEDENEDEESKEDTDNLDLLIASIFDRKHDAAGNETLLDIDARHNINGVENDSYESRQAGIDMIPNLTIQDQILQVLRAIRKNMEEEKKAKEINKHKAGNENEDNNKSALDKVPKIENNVQQIEPDNTKSSAAGKEQPPNINKDVDIHPTGKLNSKKNTKNVTRKYFLQSIFGPLPPVKNDAQKDIGTGHQEKEEAKEIQKVKGSKELKDANEGAMKTTSKSEHETQSVELQNVKNGSDGKQSSNEHAAGPASSTTVSGPALTTENSIQQSAEKDSYEQEKAKKSSKENKIKELKDEIVDTSKNTLKIENEAHTVKLQTTKNGSAENKQSTPLSVIPDIQPTEKSNSKEINAQAIGQAPSEAVSGLSHQGEHSVQPVVEKGSQEKMIEENNKDKGSKELKIDKDDSPRNTSKADNDAQSVKPHNVNNDSVGKASSKETNEHAAGQALTNNVSRPTLSNENSTQQTVEKNIQGQEKVTKPNKDKSSKELKSETQDSSKNISKVENKKQSVEFEKTKDGSVEKQQSAPLIPDVQPADKVNSKEINAQGIGATSQDITPVQPVVEKGSQEGKKIEEGNKDKESNELKADEDDTSKNRPKPKNEAQSVELQNGKKEVTENNKLAPSNVAPAAPSTDKINSKENVEHTTARIPSKMVPDFTYPYKDSMQQGIGKGIEEKKAPEGTKPDKGSKELKDDSTSKGEKVTQSVELHNTKTSSTENTQASPMNVAPDTKPTTKENSDRNHVQVNGQSSTAAPSNPLLHDQDSAAQNMGEGSGEKKKSKEIDKDNKGSKEFKDNSKLTLDKSPKTDSNSQSVEHPTGEIGTAYNTPIGEVSSHQTHGQATDQPTSIEASTAVLHNDDSAIQNIHGGSQENKASKEVKKEAGSKESKDNIKLTASEPTDGEHEVNRVKPDNLGISTTESSPILPVGTESLEGKGSHEGKSEKDTSNEANDKQSLQTTSSPENDGEVTGNTEVPSTAKNTVENISVPPSNVPSNIHITRKVSQDQTKKKISVQVTPAKIPVHILPKVTSIMDRVSGDGNDLLSTKSENGEFRKYRGEESLRESSMDKQRDRYRMIGGRWPYRDGKGTRNRQNGKTDEHRYYERKYRGRLGDRANWGRRKKVAYKKAYDILNHNSDLSGGPMLGKQNKHAANVASGPESGRKGKGRNEWRRRDEGNRKWRHKGVGGNARKYTHNGWRGRVTAVKGREGKFKGKGNDDYNYRYEKRRTT